MPTAKLPVTKWHGGHSYSIRCAGIAEPAGVPAPMGQKTQYKDGLFEKLFMSLFARKMEKFVTSEVSKKNNALWDMDYERFVDVSKRVMIGRSRKQQQEVVREVLLSMLPPGAPAQVPKMILIDKRLEFSCSTGTPPSLHRLLIKFRIGNVILVVLAENKGSCFLLSSLLIHELFSEREC